MSLRRIHRRLMIEELEPRVAPTTYIYTLDDLQNMKNNLAEDYILANDIDASATSSWNGGLGFDPVGDSSNPFRGSFDGQGHIITGLYINRPSEVLVGLFGMVTTGAAISNVGLMDVAITGGEYVGALAGSIRSGTVTNSYATGEVHSTDEYVGGLVGELYLSQMSNSYANVTVSGDTCSGGLVGMILTSTVSDSYAAGAVTGNKYVGGLAAHIYGSTASGSTISNCYAAGGVTGNAYVGGLVGNTVGVIMISSSYWDIQTSGQTSSKGGIGKTTAEMKQQATFVGWDFVNTWGIVENVTYPLLRGTIPPFILSLSVSPNPVTKGTPLLLTAEGVYDADGQVVSVSFYRDINGNGVGDSEELLGTDTSSEGGWTWSGTVTWGAGTYTYLARALDNGSPPLYSNWISATGSVSLQEIPLISGKPKGIKDGDLTDVVITLSGPGNGYFTLKNGGTNYDYIEAIVLQNTTDKSSLTINCKGGMISGTSFATLNITKMNTAGSALGRLSFKGVTLDVQGGITTDGGIKTLTIGPILDGANISIGGPVGNFTGERVGNNVHLYVLGDLGTLNVAAVGEHANIRVRGGIKTANIKTGDMLGHVIAEGPGGIGTINILKGRLAGNIEAWQGGIKTLNVNGTDGIGAGSIIAAAAGIGTITVKGNVPDLTLNSSGPVNVLNVKGSATRPLALGGVFNMTILKSLNAPYADVNNLTLQATQGLGKLHVRSMSHAIIAAGTTIGDVKISTNLTDSLILGAYGFGPNGQYDYGAGDDTYGYTAGTVIKSVTVGGVMSGTSIAANVLCGPDHYFGTIDDDNSLPGSTVPAIKAVTLKALTETTDLNDHFGIVGKGRGGTLKIGGVKINMPTTFGDTYLWF